MLGSIPNQEITCLVIALRFWGLGSSAEGIGRGGDGCLPSFGLRRYWRKVKFFMTVLLRARSRGELERWLAGRAAREQKGSVK